jgi:hypothetical protein
MTPWSVRVRFRQALAQRDAFSGLVYYRAMFNDELSLTFGRISYEGAGRHIEKKTSGPVPLVPRLFSLAGSDTAVCHREHRVARSKYEPSASPDASREKRRDMTLQPESTNEFSDNRNCARLAFCVP